MTGDGMGAKRHERVQTPIWLSSTGGYRQISSNRNDGCYARARSASAMSEPKNIMGDVVVSPCWASTDPIHPPNSSHRKAGLRPGAGPSLREGSRCETWAMLWSVHARVG